MKGKFKIIFIILGITILAGAAVVKLGGNRPSYIKPMVVFSSPSPLPSPKPTLPPINEESNLTKEINQLLPPDLSPDFSQLQEVMASF